MSSLASLGATVALVAVALLVGLAAGRIARGRVRPARPAAVQVPSALIGGLALRVLVELIDLPFGIVVLVASYGLLLYGTMRNLSWTGTGIVAIGLLAMLVPTVVNGGMPVDAEAATAVGINPVTLDSGATVALAGERHISGDESQLEVLGEIVPVPLVGRVVSFGELILLVGLSDVAFNIAARMRRRRQVPSALLTPLFAEEAERSPFGSFDETDGYTVVEVIDLRTDWNRAPEQGSQDGFNDGSSNRPSNGPDVVLDTSVVFDTSSDSAWRALLDDRPIPMTNE